MGKVACGIIFGVIGGIIGVVISFVWFIIGFISGMAVCDGANPKNRRNTGNNYGSYRVYAGGADKKD